MSGEGAPVDRESVFVAIFDAYYVKILAYARRRLGPDACEEAVADTFMSAWMHLDEAPPDPLIWLYGIARGAVANHRRRLLRSARLSERVRTLGFPPQSSEVADSVIWEDTFAASVAQLSESDREVLRLTHWEELSNAEGAAVLGCSNVAFKVRLHRARQRLRRYLEKDPGAIRRPASEQPSSSGPSAASTETPMLPQEGPCR